MVEAFFKAPFLGQIDDVGSNERTSKQLDLITWCLNIKLQNRAKGMRCFARFEVVSNDSEKQQTQHVLPVQRQSCAWFQADSLIAGISLCTLTPTKAHHAAMCCKCRDSREFLIIWIALSATFEILDIIKASTYEMQLSGTNMPEAFFVRQIWGSNQVTRVLLSINFGSAFQVIGTTVALCWWFNWRITLTNVTWQCIGRHQRLRTVNTHVMSSKIPQRGVIVETWQLVTGCTFNAISHLCTEIIWHDTMHTRNFLWRLHTKWTLQITCSCSLDGIFQCFGTAPTHWPVQIWPEDSSPNGYEDAFNLSKNRCSRISRVFQSTLITWCDMVPCQPTQRKLNVCLWHPRQNRGLCRVCCNFFDTGFRPRMQNLSEPDTSLWGGQRLLCPSAARHWSWHHWLWKSAVHRSAVRSNA